MNPLLDSGLPLFFSVVNTPALGMPHERYGQSMRTLVRSLSHMQKEALVFSRRTGATWRLASDEGAYLDGQDAAPCPLSFMTTGMVAATMNEIIALAGLRGIGFRSLRLVQDNYYTMAGSMPKGTMTGGAKDVELEVQIETDADEESVRELVEDSLACNPVYGLMNRGHTNLFSLAHNGNRVSLDDGIPRGPSMTLPTEPVDCFEGLKPDVSPRVELVKNTGRLTPRAEHTTSSPGSSLAAEQDRLLHIRGICMLRDDGMKEIEQHLFNPQGSIYRLLSEEAPPGGEGRAPDAATYMSAGIAFCFMTQFGRAAAIHKKPLDDYRIVQDTFFSTGSSNGKGISPGKADAVETAVWLKSGHDDDYARHLLRMAEQTCFLHALCRSDLKTRVNITLSVA